MIYILGDLHGDWTKLERIKEHMNPEDIIIQVGDFGIYSRELMYLRHAFPEGYPCKVLMIDGNHENFNIINEWSKDEPTEFHKNFFYMPRGYVMEIEGKLFGFLGGAESIDKAWRTPGIDWFAEERVSQDDVDKLIHNLNGRELDVLISHSPPEFVNKANFPPLNERDWGLPLGWIDESAWKVTKAYWAVKPKVMYCGHMHKNVWHANVRIVDIDEIVEYSPN
jgi:Icc-related predicted phosphoesterase